MQRHTNAKAAKVDVVDAERRLHVYWEVEVSSFTPPLTNTHPTGNAHLRVEASSATSQEVRS